MTLPQEIQVAADECHRLGRAAAAAKTRAKRLSADEAHPAYAQFFVLRGEENAAYGRWVEVQRRMSKPIQSRDARGRWAA